PADFGLAGSYAMTLLLLSAAGVLVYHRFTRQAARFATITGKGYRPRVLDLGRWRYAACGSALLIFAVTVALPVFILLWVSLTPYYGVPSWELLQRATLDAYRYVLHYPMALRAFTNSLSLAAGSATAVM